MSCIIIDTRALKRTAATVNALACSEIPGKFTLRDAMESLKSATAREFNDYALIKAMRLAFIVNCKAYRNRYKAMPAARFCSPMFSGERLKNGYSRVAPFSLNDGLAPLCQVLKTLEFLQYQCIDVSSADKEKYSKFFEQLKSFIAAVQNCVIQNVPDYQSAKWGE